MIKERISKILNYCGMQNRIWQLLWKMNMDATKGMDADHPSVVMLESRKFFETNAERVQSVADMFDDSLSKKIFLRQIEYRQTYDRSLAMPYNYERSVFPTRFNQFTDRRSLC